MPSRETADDISPIQKKSESIMSGEEKNTWQSQRDRSSSEFPEEKNLIIVRRERKRWNRIGKRMKVPCQGKSRTVVKRDKRICSEIRRNSLTLMRADGVTELKRK